MTEDMRLKNLVEIDLENLEEKIRDKFEKILGEELDKLFSDFEEGIVSEIVDETILKNMANCDNYSVEYVLTELKEALESFIIVDDDSEEDKECKQLADDGELLFCEFKGWDSSNKSVYYGI